MKVAAVADVHIGNHQRGGGAPVSGVNARARLALAALVHAVEKANTENARPLVVAGDLFDYQRPEPQLIAEVQRALGAFEGQTHVLVGNHDQVSDLTGDHALGPLAPVAHVVERPTIVYDREAEMLLVPFLPADRPAADALAEVVAGLGERQREHAALFIHAGIRDDKTAPWLRSARDAIDASVLAEIATSGGFSAVFAGNWHDRRTWTYDRVKMVQIGALAPTGFDNPGFDGYGTVAFWEPGRRTTFVEVPGPRFIKATREELPAVEKQAVERGVVAFIEVSAEPEEARALREEALARPASTHTRIEVVVDREVGRVKARSAASAARRAGTVDAAVDAFVRRMGVGEGVDRDEVAALARGYLTKGRGA